MSVVLAPPTGLRVTLLGDAWVAYSPLSGETMILNTETAAILEILGETPGDLTSVCAALAEDVGIVADDIRATIGYAWNQLIEAGLLVETHTPI